MVTLWLSGHCNLAETKTKRVMDYSQDTINYLVSYQQQRIRALEDRVNFLTEELNACYQQAAQLEEQNQTTKK